MVERLDVDWFERTFESVKAWGRWGADDERGALNLITEERVAAAAALVADGVHISCALDLDTNGGAENPAPAQHHMILAGDVMDEMRRRGLEHTTDYVGIACHGSTVSHLDALCHFSVEGRMYNDVPISEVRSSGARRLGVTSAADGIVGRGVLLDIPRVRGVDWLEPTDRVTPDDLDAAEDAHGVRVEPGDILLIAIGVARRRRAGVPLPMRERPGLHPTCIPWLHERDIAVLGGDGFSDAMGGETVDGWRAPVHQCLIVGMGVHLLDNLDLVPLADACAARGRYAFFFTAAPLRIPGGTGSALNPVAIL